jgi:hypothetical protein
MDLSSGDETGHGATVIDLALQWKIAERMGGVSRKTVLEYLKTLVTPGYIEEDTIGKTKIFRLKMPIDTIAQNLTGYKNLNDSELLKKLYYSLIDEGNRYFEVNGIDFRLVPNEDEVKGLFDVEETVKHFA